MNNSSESLTQRDLKHIWHPCTQMKDYEELPLIPIKNDKTDAQGLRKSFYAENGSSAVEVALKMSFQYHKNKGECRPYFLSLTNGYHGETLGVLSVSDVGLYKDTFDETLLHTIQTAVPKDKREQAGISPDFMTLSKGLTGGYLPLACVLTTNTMYNAVKALHV